jgi:hypothetical protein
MTHELEEQTTLAAAGSGLAVSMEAEINRLKGRLEEKQARSHSTSRREGMIEDCEIILKHLESKTR